MELKCPECGQKVERDGVSDGRQVECPSCFFHFDMPESITAVDPKEVAEELTPHNAYRKKAVQTNVIMDEDTVAAIHEAAKKRKAYAGIQGWQYLLLAIGLGIAASVWAFLKLEEYFRSTFISVMDLPTQRLFAAFFGIAAGVLIWIAARRQLWWCRFLAIASAVGLPLSVSEIQNPEGDLPDGTGIVITEMKVDETQNTPSPESIDDYREVDLEPLFEDIAQLGAKDVLGVWVRGVNNLNQNQLLSYLRRMSRIKGEPKLYARQPGALFVINKSDLTFKEFLEILKPIGTIELTDEQSKFVDLKLNQSLFPEPPPVAMLQDSANQYFIEANYKELCSFDMKRIEAAARRLAKERPRDDVRVKIVTQLDRLINEPWGHDVNYLTGLIMAFATWAPAEDDKAQQQVAYVSLKLIEANKEVPEVCVAFMLEGRKPYAAATFMEAWRKDPFRWENDLMKFGEAAEKEILGAITGKTISNDLASSALRIMEQVGTPKSLPFVKQQLQNQDAEVSNLAKAALREIDKRYPQEKAERPAKDEGKPAGR